MSTTTPWKRRDYKRACSICSHTWMFSKMRAIGQGRWACPDDAEGLTAEQISRHNAHARALKVRPVKHPLPATHTDIYQLEEAQIFNFVTSVAPYNTQADKDNNGTKSAQAAARAAIYLADILLENTRPAVWLNAAQAALDIQLTYLLTLQYGSPTGPFDDDPTSKTYGGVKDGDDYLITNVTALTGVAFLKSYQILGQMSHLDVAKRCATFIRHQQRAGYSTGSPIPYASDQTLYADSAYVVPGVAAGVDIASTGILPDYYLSDQGACAWFISLLSSIVGASTTFGETSTARFTGSTLATLAQMLADIVSFLTTGARDTTASGALVVGLSTTTPKLYYRASTLLFGTRSFWSLAGADAASILTDQWALCLFGLNAAGVLSAEVTALYNYLMAMTSNVANVQTSLSKAGMLANLLGAYDPTVAPAVSVTGTTESTGSVYSWSAAAWLAAIASVRTPAAFKRSKDILSVPRRISTTSYEVKYMGPLGRAGLSFQVAGLTQQVAVP
jgi:hypothetical protein